jgi:hypothetical protein
MLKEFYGGGYYFLGGELYPAPPIPENSSLCYAGGA